MTITNPLQNLFIDIKKIMDYIVIKDRVEAEKYETLDSNRNAELWMFALLQQDTYITYHAFYTPAMFQEVVPNTQIRNIYRWLDNIYSVPLIYQEHLLKRGREIVLRTYEEGNNYYRMLYGLPNLEDKNYIYLSNELSKLYNVSISTPIHKLDVTTQNRYMTTDEFKNVLLNNPDKLYLNYIGMYKIEPIVARRAKDLQLIRYIPLDRTDINPNLIKEFSDVYASYRDFVMYTYYNRDLERTLINYRSFMSIMIMYYTLMQICNKCIEHSTDMRFLDDAVLHIILDLYQIPKSVILTPQIKRNFVAALKKLIRKKATNEVFYDLVKILGYEKINISKLMMMKQQSFIDGQAIFTDNTDITTSNDIDILSTLNPITGLPIKSMESEIYFQTVDLKSKDPYDDIINNRGYKFTYEEVTQPDPRWWELPDTQHLVRDKFYTNADSKYIMVEATIDQLKQLFESVYFMRMILDNKKYTDLFMITIPEIFDQKTFSLFDLMVFLLAASCEEHQLEGNIITNASGLLSIAGFNFDIDISLLKDFLNNTNYTDKDRLLSFISDLSMQSPMDINRIFNEIMIPLRDWLTYEMRWTNNRDQFNEYEKLYRSLYTYDIVRDIFVDDFIRPSDRICKKYNITDIEYKSLALFYPHTISGKLIDVNTMVNYQQYFPFIDDNDKKTWYITTSDNEYVYFYDILMSDDCRYIFDENNNKIPNPIFWKDGIINKDKVKNIINSINLLSDIELNNAYYKTTTYIPNSNIVYSPNQKLPSSIRNEIFKKIIIDKFTMDMDGNANPPTTYKEYLQRKNPLLYSLFDKYESSHEDWLNDIMYIITAIESTLDMKLKYLEESIGGSELFFRPLVALIKYFKSYMIDFVRTGFRYIFDDVIDSGGNINAIRLFDEIHNLTWHMTIGLNGRDAELGLYDTMTSAKWHIIFNDKSEMLQTTPNDIIVNKRQSHMGSMRIVDECKFFINGTQLDPDNQFSYWTIGEHDVGRYVNESDHYDEAYKETVNIKNTPVDLESWKLFVEK